ncbi:MAG: 1-acyl-sn-glycerol-3-phosphate acyltransferase [Rhodospirillaceae bacterium]|nr:1-acyl-sn-glycerol-3-phosphate acyltransferase [Rhodospirillaceae bacterium]
MTLLRLLFFLLLVRPAVLLLLGLYVRGREKLPRRGPAIVVANHNSHLDTLVLLSLFPLALLPKVRPVAAADYFLGEGSALGWIARRLIGIIPIRRHGTAMENKRDDPLRPAAEALAAGGILVIYPEGTRGEPERIAKFRIGVAYLVERFTDVPVVPVYLAGLGKAWPKGERWPVPLLCEVFVGDPLRWSGDRGAFIDTLEARVREMAKESDFPGWGDDLSAADEKRALDKEG